MRKKIAKSLLHAVAPRLSFAALHPKRSASRKVSRWAEITSGSRRHERSATPGIIGLGAAALALPIGVLIGRRLSRSRGSFPGRPV